MDIRYYQPNITFDYVVGNPPYNLRWYVGNCSYLSEFYYCLKAAELLKPAGIMAIIVPMSFCADDFSDRSMIEEIQSKFNFICQVALSADTFAHLGVTNYKTKILFMQKKAEALEDVPFSTEVLHYNGASMVWQRFIQPITEKKDVIKQQIFLEIMRGGKEDEEWNNRVHKLLYDISRNPATRIFMQNVWSI